MKILNGHNNFETAFIVNNYPYGRLRTDMAYWIEKGKNGFRLCRQSLNPKTGQWNKPKKSTYSQFLLLAQNPENGHVSSIGFSRYSEVKRVKEFLEKYRSQLSHEQVKEIEKIISLKQKASEIYDQAMQEIKEEKRIEKIELGKLYLKSEISRLAHDTKLLKISFVGKGIKKRCRKLENHYEVLGYIARPENYIPDHFQDHLTFKYEIKKGLENIFREYDFISVKVSPVELQARKEDSVFYGLKELLFSPEARQVNAKEFLEL